MAKQAADRYASMAELATALTGVLRSPAASSALAGAPTPPAPRARRWARPLASMAATLGVLLIGLVIVYVTTNKGRIKIVVDDPKAVVKVDALDVRIEALAEPINLRAGEHALQVKRNRRFRQSRSPTQSV
jgi:hypothetical protein